MEKNYNVGARSKRNGIIFLSTKCPLFGSETFRDESGEIQTRIVPIEFDNYKGYLEDTLQNKKSHSMDIALIFDILLITICLLSRNFWLISAALYFSSVVSFELFKFMEQSYQKKSKKGNNKSTARYHSAEHMVINCYEKLKRIPTFEEVKNASRFHKRCGSRVTINNIVMHLLISLSFAFAANWNIFFRLSLCILILIFRLFADKKGWLRFLQVFVTEKPSDEDIELAIEGIKNYEKMENIFQDDSDLIEMFNMPPSGIFISF